MNNVIVLHEGNGRVYFEALNELDYIELSHISMQCIRILIKYMLRHTSQLNFVDFFKSIIFRVNPLLARNKTILVCVQPFDKRLYLYLAHLLLAKSVILHTSSTKWKNPASFSFFERVWIIVFLRIFNKVVCPTQSVSMMFREMLQTFETDITVLQIGYLSRAMLGAQQIPLQEHLRMSFGFCGRLVRDKGIDKFLKLSTLMPQHRFYVCGEDSDGIMNSLPANVEYMGQIPNDRLNIFFEKIQILILAQRRTNDWEEFFGMSIIESAFFGVPVISANHVGPSEILNESHFGVLVRDNASIDELLSAIDTISRDINSYRVAANTFQKLYLNINSIKWINLLGV